MPPAIVRLAPRRRYGPPKLAAVLAGAAAAAALAVGPAKASDGFCGVLKTAAADAGAGFSSMRGAEIGHIGDDGGGDDETSFAARRRLPGALGCDVDKDRSDYEDSIPSFDCWFASAPSKQAMVRRLADRIRACIGPAATDQFAADEGDIVAEADFDRHGYLISVSAGDGADTLLEMTPK